MSLPDLQGWQRCVDEALRLTNPLTEAGHIYSVTGGLIRARGVNAAIGELCELCQTQSGVRRSLGLAEVVGLQGPDLLLSGLAPLPPLANTVQVIALNRRLTVPAGDDVLGRVLDGYGRPIDDVGTVHEAGTVHNARTTHGVGTIGDAPDWNLDRQPPAALSRQTITRPLLTGIRAIDALLSCGQGQRLAIFSPAGTGKSSLIAALVRQCKADVVVLALVGERGREVGDFVRDHLGEAMRQRCVVLASTSDRPALERIKCAQTATAIAEQFCAQGKHVLLLVDSITRLVRAQRELALNMGEASVSDALAPAVLTTLPALFERAGPARRGAISAFYAVLTEDDRGRDPIAEEVRSLVDGHIVLTRALADAGHFPAIDILRSVSRVMPRIVSARHAELALQLRALIAKLASIELLVQVGEYQPGSDPLADRALALRAAIDAFLRQPIFGNHEVSDTRVFASVPVSVPASASVIADADLGATQSAMERLLHP